MENKDLLESRPEPDCGNCPRETGSDSLSCGECKRRSKPKPAKPQGWEQRFDGEFSADFYAIATKHMDNVRAFIRAEIERVYAGYAPLICAIEMAFKEADFLPDGRLTRKARAVFEPIRQAEQNRHREGGK